MVGKIEGGKALLATALVVCEGVKEPIRALCDMGAQANIISAEEVRKRKWKVKPSTSRLLGFNDVTGMDSLQEVTINIHTKGMLDRIRITLVVVPELNMWLPERRRLDVQTPPGFAGELADPSFREPGPVKMILGAGVLAWIIEESIFHNGMRWQNSQLGWYVYGGEQISLVGDVAMNVIQDKEREDKDKVEDGRGMREDFRGGPFQECGGQISSEDSSK